MDLDKFRQLLDIDEARMQAKLDKAEEQVQGAQHAFENLL